MYEVRGTIFEKKLNGRFKKRKNTLDGTSPAESPHSMPRHHNTMEDESGKNKALGVPGLMLAAVKHVIEDVKGLHARASPWRELVDYRSVSVPTDVSDGLRRLRRNANDLGYNYFLILLGVVGTRLVLRPKLLLPIAGILALWIYVLRVRASDVHVAGKTFGARSQRVALVVLAFIVLHMATNVSSVLFGALFWVVLGITAHASLRTPPPGDDAPSDGGFAAAFLSSGEAAWRGVKGPVEAAGVPSRWIDTADQAWARISGTA